MAKWPVDVAAVKVANIPPDSSHKAVPKDRLSERYAAVDGELLFWMGFPGFKLARHDPIHPDKRRTTLFGELQILALPMLSKAIQGEGPEHPAFDHKKHIALHYPSAAKRVLENAEVALPNPKGMSGSILWNTRFVETMRAGKNGSQLTAKCVELYGPR